jgi:hypothetical protein
VGHCYAHCCDTEGIKTVAGLQPKRSKVLTSIGRGAAPVWCHSRERAEAARDARPSHEAGTNSVRFNFCMAVELSDASGQ